MRGTGRKARGDRLNDERKLVEQLDKLGLLEAPPNDKAEPLPPDGERGRH
jgi:hypothetical protein